MRRVFLVLGALWLLGCGRDPGPSSDEHGLVFYWEVTDSELVLGQQCSDSEGFPDALGLVPFEAGTYLVYQVSDDGTQAVDQLCETTESSTCVDGGVVFDVDGSELIYDPDGDRTPIQGGGVCQLDVDERWVLVDEGSTLSFSTDILFTLAGPAGDCDPVQEAFEDEAPNGLGLDGCLATISGNADFFSAD